ncbi:MAG: hypothetical protein QOD09_1294 [Bradyrhizobium sp.]|nr:hypothetical protein [Bradyrhizobium sp.]
MKKARAAAVEQHSGLPVLAFADLAALETWFGSQPGDAPGVWIKFARKGTLKTTLTKDEAIDAALCHGWIDGRLEKYSDTHWLVRFTPRRPASKWSLRNRKRALELKKQGRMQPAGLAQIEAAMADGRWDQAYASASAAKVPSDLQSALNANRKAAAFFKTLSSRNRYAILYRIGVVKKADTRKRKIEEFVAMLERGETIHG